MKSFIDPICHILESLPIGCQSSADAISQFISTCEIDSEILYSLSTDPQFPPLVRHFTTEAIANMKESTGISTVSDLASSILQFLSSISMRHPVIHEIITSNTNLDDLILAFYDYHISKADIRNINAPLIFPYLKFIALLSASHHVDIIQPKTLEIIFNIASSLLDNPQLAAWSAAIIAGLSRNCPAAEAHIKTMPNLLKIKRDLSSLFSSNDVCIVCAALSATVSLFPIGTDAVSALRASTHFIASDSQFQLLLPLAADAIRDLVQKTKLTEEELTTLLMTAVTAKGYNAYTLFHLLVDLTEYHPAIASIVKTTEYLETLFVSLLSHEEEFVAESGCHLLLCLADNDPHLFVGLNETNLFMTIFSALTEIPVNESSFRSEPFVILLRFLYQGGPPKKSDIALLTQKEDYIFTTFLRHIENNESFLSVCLFLFISQSAKYIKGWTMRLKRIVIDSVFPALVVNVLNESENKHATKDALNALMYFCGCKEPEFFDLFISSYVLLVQRSKEEKKTYIKERNDLLEQLTRIKIEKVNSDSQIEELNQLNSQMINELNISRTKSSMINIGDNNNNTINSNKLEHLKAQIRSLKEENEILKMKTRKQRKDIHQLKSENIGFISKLQSQSQLPSNIDINRKSKSDIVTNNQDSKMTVSVLTNRNFRDEELEEKLASAHKVIYDNSQKMMQLESDLRVQVAANEQLKKELNQLKTELNKEKDHSNQLQMDIEQIEKQNVQYRTLQKDINHIKRKYATKRQQLQEKMAEVEREKGKWESIARFYNKLCQSKGDTMKEVYHVFS
ncbi:hypothetical protein TRFO_18194 [Tritrichomonas foetus]|uniref:Uncharacterized protein n=1 Tax=Tritrichomonas foetus TaxID=1144522 RepID=A0A1J4KR84_9EUKA|nr:hypothetical protein TRFO_18194 [Tritrichomonas foetus]|eukprot:OHT12182.1 hypothetical protein TRFO_18194 [Tritrichomonas foetus]